MKKRSNRLMCMKKDGNNRKELQRPLEMGIYNNAEHMYVSSGFPRFTRCKSEILLAGINQNIDRTRTSFVGIFITTNSAVDNYSFNIKATHFIDAATNTLSPKDFLVLSQIHSAYSLSSFFLFLFLFCN